MSAEICRSTLERASTSASLACLPAVSLPVTPGLSEAQDMLTGALLTAPAVLLSYRIKLMNSAGRSAGVSAAAFAAGGPGLPPIEALQAKGSQEGVVLEWRQAASPAGQDSVLIELKRTEIMGGQPGHRLPAGRATATSIRRPGKHQPASSSDPTNGSDVVTLHAPEQQNPDQQNLDRRQSDEQNAHSDRRAGTVDETAVVGETYRYVAGRVRALTLGGHALEVHSEPSAPVTVTFRDTFPPKSPAGLETVAGPQNSDGQLSIDLSWEPNGEADLNGYVVYRQLAGTNGAMEGPAVRLTALPIDGPAFRDVAVKAGQGYIYYVTAVDASGNESAPSAKAREMIESPP